MSIKVKAIAARDPRCNAVGTLELECTELGLSMRYLGMSAFSEGYAPTDANLGSNVLVPWAAVEEVNIEGEQLFLVLDAKLTPLNRMLLANFSDKSHTDHHELYRQRSLVRAATIAAIVIVALLSWVAIPRATVERPLLLATLVAVIAGGLILALGLAADHWLIGGGTDGERIRSTFFGEIGFYLPTLIRKANTPAKPVEPWRWAPQTLFPRSTAAIVIALSASGLAALLTGHWLLDHESPRAEMNVNAPRRDSLSESALESETSQASPQIEPSAPPAKPNAAPAPAVPSAPAPNLPTAIASEACRCERADSVLWQSPLPRLSPVLISQHSRPHKDHSHLSLELGVVNNGNRDISELGIDVQFYEDGTGAKAQHKRRKRHHLFFEGPLKPGHAVKWHLESRGTSFELENPFSETLSPNGDDAAPAEAFYELLAANHRPIRLHGSMMLAFLGDQRAKEGALSLRDALREDEAPYLDRVLFSLDPLRACKLAASATGPVRELQACIYNAGTIPKPGAELRLRALDHGIDHRNPVARPPTIVAEQAIRLTETLEPNAGRWITASIDTTNPDGIPVETFEIVVDDPNR